MNNIKYDKLKSVTLTLRYLVEYMARTVLYLLQLALDKGPESINVNKLSTLAELMVDEKATLKKQMDANEPPDNLVNTVCSCFTGWFEALYAFLDPLDVDTIKIEAELFTESLFSLLNDTQDIVDAYIYPEIVNAKYAPYRFMKLIANEDLSTVGDNMKVYRIIDGVSTIEEDDLPNLISTLYDKLAMPLLTTRLATSNNANGSLCFGAITIKEGIVRRSILVLSDEEKTQKVIENTFNECGFSLMPGSMFINIDGDKLRIAPAPLPGYLEIPGSDMLVNTIPNIKGSKVTLETVSITSLN